MKTAPQLILLVLIAAAAAGGGFWLKGHMPASKPAETPAEKEKAAEEEEAEGPKVTRDTNGNAVITISDEMQGDMGVKVANPVAMQLHPEKKGYGRVLDPAPLSALMSELALAENAIMSSSNELARLKVLLAQGNTSARVFQAAEATVLRDQLAVRGIKERLVLAWGKAVAARPDLLAFAQSLSSMETTLVRVDLPVGDNLESPGPTRIFSLSGKVADAEFLGLPTSVDPQMQGRGFVFLVRQASWLSPGQAVLAQIEVPGEPISGVVVPRDAVVRTEGAGWVYVLDSHSAEAFTRTEIPLDRPTEAGWFVAKGLAASDYVVIKAAQQLLSIE
jgi:hypothetical protein